MQEAATANVFAPNAFFADTSKKLIFPVATVPLRVKPKNPNAAANTPASRSRQIDVGFIPAACRVRELALDGPE